jgi:hypothetical protein
VADPGGGGCGGIKLPDYGIKLPNSGEEKIIVLNTKFDPKTSFKHKKNWRLLIFILFLTI